MCMTCTVSVVFVARPHIYGVRQSDCTDSRPSTYERLIGRHFQTENALQHWLHRIIYTPGWDKTNKSQLTT